MLETNSPWLSFLKCAPSEGVLVKNPKAQFEVWLSGNVDYCTYEQETDRGMTFAINTHHTALNVFLSYGVTSIT